MAAKKTIIIIAIAILFVFFVGFGMETFYPQPRMDPCAYEPEMTKPNMVGSTCATVSPDNRDDCCVNKGYKYFNPDTQMCKGTVCDYEAFQKVTDQYNRNVALILLAIGLTAVFLGIKGPRMEQHISSGLMGGGVLTIIYGIIRYWGNMNDVMRFVVIGIILILVVYIGTKYKKYLN